MYLYFNKEGILTTSIPHGEPVRQGSFLNIYVCLDVDFFEDDIDRKKHALNIELTLPTGVIGTTNCVPEIEPSIQTFRKTSDSEVTYDLIDGAPYWTYYFRFSPETSTNYHGVLKANISIKSTYEDEYGDVLEIDRVQFGETQIFVEKTFGFGKKAVDNSTLHYENLIIQINEIDKKVNLKIPANADSTYIGENEPPNVTENGYYNVWLDLGELGNEEIATYNLRRAAEPIVETNVVEVVDEKTNEIIEVYEPTSDVIEVKEDETITVYDENKAEQIVVLNSENEDEITIIEN